jgi:hypothetical protein
MALVLLLSSGRFFPAPMNLRKDDVLASNLLFGFLAISVVEQFVLASMLHFYLELPNGSKLSSVEMTSVSAAIWLPQVIGWVAISSCYYAVRKGKQWAKVLVLVLFVWRLYSSTYLADSVFAGVIIRGQPNWSSLVAAFKVMLNVAALVLMFRKPQVTEA